MSSKVYCKNFEQLTEQKVEKYNGAYVFTEIYKLRIYTNVGVFEQTFDVGYISNCGSVPKAFQWFLKSYDPERPMYNAAFFFHDDCYQKKGYGFFSRDDVDAICRGMLRCAGENRIHASTMDFAVGIVAKSHWGTNEYGNLDCFSRLERIG